MNFIRLFSIASLLILTSGTEPALELPSKKFKEDLVQQINKVRIRGCYCGSTFMPPVNPVTWNDQLAVAASHHARDMATNKYFSHTSRNGKTLKDRIYQAGYTLSGWKSIAFGENIAWGQRSASEVMTSWIKSERHCKNLMNSAFREVGVAEVNNYWVQNFGGRVKF